MSANDSIRYFQVYLEHPSSRAPPRV
jgi:hypothetical protein